MAGSMPFSAVVQSYRRDHLVPAHDHAFPQLLYASSGLMRVESPRGAWVVPPQWAVWLPPQCVHETKMLTDVLLSPLYLERSGEWEHMDCAFVEVSPLLRELIAVIAKDADKPVSRRDELIAQLIVEELASERREGWPIAMPQDLRLKALCRKVLNEPSAHATLDDLSYSVGLSPKTAARLFEKELGMSFRRWRETVHVATAVALFSQGMPVKAVASHLGYTASSFSVMFRRHSGNTPKELKGLLQTRDAEAALED